LGHLQFEHFIKPLRFPVKFPEITIWRHNPLSPSNFFVVEASPKFANFGKVITVFRIVAILLPEDCWLHETVGYRRLLFEF
jgi:hypothetical protein